MIDIHNHILPGIDDGSRDMTMSVDMAKIFLDQGVKKIIATPHYIQGVTTNSFAENKVILADFRGRLKEENIPLEVYLGHEIMISPDIIRALEEKHIASLNNTSYVLVELPMLDMPIYTDSILYELLVRGYQPIIAHPERYAPVVEDPSVLFELVEKGALAQLNLPSLEGKYGKKIAKTAQLLLEHNLIHFVSSDAHSSSSRSPHIKNSLETLKKLVSKEDFYLLTHKNAQDLLEDKKIQTKTPLKYKKPKFFFFTR